MTATNPVLVHRPSPLRLWSGRIGAVAAASLGIVHLVVNTIGLIIEDSGQWLGYLVWGLTPSLVAWIIAYAAWRYASGSLSRSAEVTARVIMIIGAVLLSALLIHQIAFQGWRLLHPVGPGLWSLIGAPTLLLAAVTGAQRR